MTVRDLLDKGSTQLSAHSAARLECELLLAAVLGVGRSFLFAHPERAVAPEEADAYDALLQRRAGGEPLAYITGQREFWSLPLKVTPAVLIPRPETERLVEAALERIPPGSAMRIADLGTGSGAIALALASERPRCEIHATERSETALAVARENAARLHIRNVDFHRGSWFEPLFGTFGLIVSNPPYVAAGDPHLEEGDLRFEPKTAQSPGPEGLEAIRQIIGESQSRLEPGGWLLLEHGHDQGAACRALLEEHGFEAIETLTDLQGIERVSLGRRRD